MIQTNTFAFLKGISAHNEKAWLDTHREDYAAAKADVTEAARVLIERAGEFDAKVEQANDDPARCVSRLNGDMRFSRGKPPYKTEFFISLGLGELQSSSSNYVHVEPGWCYTGGGIFITQPGALGRIRDRIVAWTDKWDAVMHAAGMRTLFPDGLTSPDTLKQAPRGYDAGHEAIAYLQMKGFCANRPLTDELMQADEAFDEVVRTFKAARPLVDFINEAAMG